ncbi:ABC transporter permease [Vermiculatibacterium agrestimuris]|jgi:AI-2 transport system permease protein|uniref:ABC transporter permease n=1 Tax=Vermiculatibacterium agrestimuris TaxID=2941519 RepID=UPI002040F7B1|nr:ABC transporter permease [Vermiculatibacterium agrestimuris]
MSAAKKVLKAREMTALLFLVLLFILVGIRAPAFLADSKNVANCFNDSVVYILIAVAMAFAIFIGEIDVSVGSNLGLVAAVVGTMLQDGKSWALAFLIGILMGAVVGLVNGWGVAVMRIPSLIFTLGTNGILRGLMYLQVGTKQVTDLPIEFKSASSFTLGGFPLTVCFFCVLLLVAAIHVILTRTKRGRYFIAVGDNAGGADLVGIPATRTKVLAYVICGVLCAVAGILFASRAGQVTSQSGNGYEMKAVAACVLGGISLSGGVGSVIGASIGAVIMASISALLVFMGFSSNFDGAITGVILITIVVVDALMQRRANLRNRHARLAARTTVYADGKEVAGK